MFPHLWKVTATRRHSVPGSWFTVYKDGLSWALCGSIKSPADVAWWGHIAYEGGCQVVEVQTVGLVIFLPLNSIGLGQAQCPLSLAWVNLFGVLSVLKTCGP